MGEAVAKRTVLRPASDTRPAEDTKTLKDVGLRVAEGNCLMHPSGASDQAEVAEYIGQGVMLTSGRHLQHGDSTQPGRALELFTNCAHSGLSHTQFWLLLNGSGVGRAYDDRLVAPVAQWQRMPELINTLSRAHADYSDKYTAFDTMKDRWHLEVTDADQLTSDEVKNVTARAAEFFQKPTLLFRVQDSRESWAKALELVEVACFLGGFEDWAFIIDWSLVRKKGSPIAGMQDRPAAGPCPTMDSFIAMHQVKATKWAPWKMAMFVDHHMAACVQMGGARRAARIAIKFWKDPGIFEFILVKQQGELWSSNNSVACDEEFYLALEDETHEWHAHATTVMRKLAEASYTGHPETGKGAGEPGIVNVGKLVANNEGLEDYKSGSILGKEHYPASDLTDRMIAELVDLILTHAYQYGVNPCGEIALFLLGAYCVIADVVLYHALNAEMRDQAMRLTVRFLMRANLMSAFYQMEVRRTNRIGVGLTGIHEFAWTEFGLTWQDLTDPDITKSMPFWLELSRLARVVDDECERYAPIVGLPLPHTRRTIKPSGSVSKLFGLTEGAHLASMLFYIRWVQFLETDPIVAEYEGKGYPVQYGLKTYPGMCIVGFPTRLHITEIMPTELITTAAQATLEQQYTWVERLERYWLTGVEEDGVTLRPDYGNQVSYTAKYDPKELSFDDFFKGLTEGQKRVRCMSVMPQGDESGYEYQPEQMVTPEQYAAIVMAITDVDVEQDIDLDDLKCQSGACPL